MMKACEQQRVSGPADPRRPLPSISFEGRKSIYVREIVEAIQCSSRHVWHLVRSGQIVQARKGASVITGDSWRAFIARRLSEPGKPVKLK